MRLLTPSTQNYPWGSKTLVAHLRGEGASDRPEAELWYGAHPQAPARLAESGETLEDLIAADPEGALGVSVRERFGDRLPFLLKILAAGETLSLQAHPSLEQARAGFAAENEAGVPMDAPNRKYRDDNHKPELVVALSEFKAMAGFRPLVLTLELLHELQCETLEKYLTIVDESAPEEEGLRALFTTLITIPAEARRGLVAAVVEAAEGLLGRGVSGWKAEVLRNILALNTRYPGDVGVLGALLLNHITLQPGEALFLDAGYLHAYISGLGVEIMASSDNVLRGGLTAKHVDVPELLKVLKFKSIEDPRVAQEAGEYPVPVEDFRISRIELDGDERLIEHEGPAIILCTSGEPQVGDAQLQPTQAVWVDASQGPVRASGSGELFLASV